MLAGYLLRRRLAAVTATTIPHLFLLRHMGGGPRTFPGGLSKWKYRRMHEKLAREKERKLLQQEKELYQARLRSEIRGHLCGGPPPGDGCPALEYAPMSSKDHVKALADRFMKPGAEDLWNEDDGPLDTVTPHLQLASVTRPRASSQLDSRSLLLDRRNLADNSHTSAWRQVESFYQSRGYSVQAWRRRSRLGSSSDTDVDSSYFVKDDYMPSSRRSGLPSSGEEVESKLDDRKNTRKAPTSSAALGDYDKKMSKRVPFHMLEKITSQQTIDSIREELLNRQATAKQVELSKAGGEPVFSQKRY